MGHAATSPFRDQSVTTVNVAAALAGAPHPEGTRDPIGRFESHLERFDWETRSKFYVDNMRELVGSSARHAHPAAT